MGDNTIKLRQVSALESIAESLLKISSRTLLIPKVESSIEYTYVEWISCKEKLPDNLRPVLVSGITGHRPPHDFFVLSAYYQPLYESPKVRWRDMDGDALIDRDFEPLAWAEMINIPDMGALLDADKC